MDARIWHEIGLEFGEVDVQRTIKANGAKLPFALSTLATRALGAPRDFAAAGWYLVCRIFTKVMHSYLNSHELS